MMRNILLVILWSSAAVAQTATGAGAARCGEDHPERDCRENLDASFFTGIAVDTFGAADDSRYLNRSAADGKHERAFAGLQFGYRLAGNRNSGRQLWLHGETLHGVRSAEIECESSAGFLPCGGTANPTERALLIVRNASTLEGTMGFRLELLRLHAGEDSPGVVYTKAQAGFLKVAGTSDDAVEIHHVGLGVLSTQGVFRGSYLETLWGRNDLFPSRNRNRWKADARLVRRLGNTPMSFFARMVIDSDAGVGPDTIQSYIGIDFNIKQFRGPGR